MSASASRSVPLRHPYRVSLSGTTDGAVAPNGTAWHKARKHWRLCVAPGVAPSGTAKRCATAGATPEDAPPTYPVLVPRQWYVREGEEQDSGPRDALTRAEDTDRAHGPRTWRDKAAGPDKGERLAVLDQIAELIADAIWTELTGDSEGSRSDPHGELTVVDEGESR